MRAAAALALLLGGVALPAAAQNPCPGSISATALRPVPANAAVAVPGRIDSPQEQRMRDAAVAALGRTGRKVADDAPYALAWRGGLTQDGAGGDGLSLGQLYGDPTFRDSDDLTWVQDAPRVRRGGAAGAPRLQAAVELRDRASGRVVWTAVVSCQRQGFDDSGLFNAIAAAVVPLIGQTVAGRPF